MEELSEEALLEYISAAGGRVKNSDLLRDFKHFINHSDKNVRAKHREDFKQIIDKIALVKTDNGEKFLTLKKKYKQLLPEREREPGSDGERASVPRQGGMVMWEGGEVSTGLSPQVQPSLEPSTPTEATQDLKTNSPDRRDKGRSAAQNRAVCSWSGGPAIIVTVCSDPPTQDLNPSVVWEEPSPQEGPQEQEQPESPRQAARGCASAPQVEDPLAQSPKEDEQDAVSKSETEQDEDGTGSMGSSAIALDPLEKEWIHSAACGRLPVLNHLLQQDPTLVYKKDFTSGFTALHWAAKHGKEDMATMLVDAGLDVNTRAHGYTPLHIAALHNHRHIIDLLINYGAKQDVRDYSGQLALQYLKMQHSSDGRSDAQFPVSHGNERRSRKLATLFSGSSKKRWGSAEDLASGEEKGGGSQLLMPPAFRPRKFSR
ncbi:ankyrin repeat domain-containing protein SOWAHC isoform X2 [Polyodon spathula]|uniref:ankyrin repeat domain-containing protein SOWAHC isoform X2 n=1 Tax=Polyodon spathula TaxID=7913 RepID=UPI001B7F08B3|nr:ankyrin repeat domain-containing protein SOWAHC isoform X2 [Polyodon spathula]